MILQFKISILFLLLFVVSFLFLWRWGIRWSKGIGEHHGVGLELIWFVVYLLLMALGIRGTLDAKPLRVTHAFAQGNTELGHLALNPLYTIGNTLRKGDATIPEYYPAEEAEKTVKHMVSQSGFSFESDEYPVLRLQSYYGTPVGQRNLVIVVLEGWSAQHVGALGAERSQTPVFDSLAREGILFENFLANGRRSVEGMTAICLGLPPYRDVDVQSGSLGQNRYLGIAEILGGYGYSSLFIHGGKSGTLGLDGFSRVAGFKSYIGMDDLNLADGDFDGAWGVFDHAMARHLNNELSSMKEPFISLWFTLSSHNPFVLPDDSFKVNPSDLEGADFLDSLHYSDHSLGEFLDAARSEKYFENTVFIIVSDHTAGAGLTTLRQRHHVPLLLYAPGLVQPGRDDQISSQMDLLPTLLDLAGVSGRHHAFGQSLLRERDGFAIASIGGGYAWFRQDGMITLNIDGSTALEGSIDQGMLKEARSFLQVSKRLIRDNRLAPLR
jgi:phosphoglycerol transferase MdoB-like AlkP superfamily enzyme